LAAELENGLAKTGQKWPKVVGGKSESVFFERVSFALDIYLLWTFVHCDARQSVGIVNSDENLEKLFEF